MKKRLMILSMGLFFGAIGYTSTANANVITKTEISDCKDDCKKDCCKDKKSKETKKEAKSCSSKEGKKSCCSKKKAEEK
ncbi:hypothetical protein [Brumimicrobium aurantiacum]|uniref:Uncharacterized protein n=1 Tax=Brumimicrobium aurantiacum TaxID=1737063 RepID=A0A3E1EZ18_9FLAO|nr:hypothetical protein [Brumimicrobium aurantiacum]RFC54811.1 hypothetical protein DXU93_07450 [Brumimicrobium aurantiacum]